MPLVTLLTGAEMPIADNATELITAALAVVGVDSRTIVWSDAAAMAEPSDAVIISTTWDYSRAADRFVAALRSAAGPVYNPVDVVEWNLHKKYLIELSAAGVAVVPTRLIRPGDDADLGSGEVVLKPAISAGAHGLGRFDAAEPAAAEHLNALLQLGDVLVQPFRPEVLDGERSLIFLGGVFSHAVRKVPADNDFRVQEELGGMTTAYRPTDAELQLAETALAQVDAPVLYARVDLIGSRGGPLLMELELIEPDLFLSHSDGAAGRLADAIRTILI